MDIVGMVSGVQIAGLFLAITAVLAFTAWAETWLASPAPSVKAMRTTARSASSRPLGISLTDPLTDRSGDDVALVR